MPVDNPSTMFGQLPEMGQGPLSGYMRGLMADTSLNAQGQASTQRDLENQINQLKLQQAQKQVPLEDANTANAMWQAQDQSAANASGMTGQINQSGREAALAGNQTKLSDSQIHQQLNQSVFYSAAADGMKNVQDPAQKQAMWEQWKSYGEKFDVKGLPDFYSPMVQASLDQKASIGGHLTDHLNKMQLEKQKSDLQAQVFEKELPGRIQIAQASAGALDNRTMLNMDPDKRAQTLVERKIVQGEPITQNDINTLVSVFTKQDRADPAVAKAASSAETDFRSTNDAGRKVLNKEVGLPEGNTNTAKYSEAYQDAYVKLKVDKDIKDRYGAAKTIDGSTVEEKLGKTGRAPDITSKPASKAAATIPEVSSPTDYSNLPDGAKYKFKGKVLVKGGVGANATPSMPPPTPAVAAPTIPSSGGQVPPPSPEMSPQMGNPNTGMP